MIKQHTGEFYTTDGSGNLSLLKQHTDWRKSWRTIVPGSFGGSSFTDLLFYDQQNGIVEFYTTDGSGNLSLLKQHTGWRKSWRTIVPGNFSGSSFTDLLFSEIPRLDIASFKNFVPQSDFRTQYSNLVKAIWPNPELASQIESDPSLLKQYGFTTIPKRVRFATTVGLASPAGFESQRTEFQEDAQETVTFYIPPAPTIDELPMQRGNVTVCCCCCPCCCCT